MPPAPEMRTPLLLTALFSFCLAPSTFGQSPWEASPNLTDTPPTVDGILRDPVWEGATRLGSLSTVVPVEGKNPLRGTDVRLLRSATTLFIGVLCTEEDGRHVALRQMARDGDVSQEDYIAFVLDPLNDGQSGFLFEVGAAGGKTDGLISANGRRVDRQWDGVWKSQTRIGTNGWSAEIAIPISTLSAQTNTVWGFNIERYRAGQRTIDRWASSSRGVKLTNLSYAGKLTEMDFKVPGHGISVRPFAKTSWRHDIVLGNGWQTDQGVTGQMGVDVDWQIDSSTKAGFTLNPDFSETEVDYVRLDKTRFPDLYPEKRDFFLESSSFFDFGPLHDNPDVVPFNTRSIGLLGGEEISIAAGARVAGRRGPLSLGAMAVSQDSETLSVLRPTFDLSRDLRIGALLTTGDPANPEDALSLGFDVRYLNSSLLDGTIGLNAWGVRAYDDSFAEGSSDHAWGLEGDFRTDHLSGSLSATGVGIRFRPALGYVRDNAAHIFRASTFWEPHQSGKVVRHHQFGASAVMHTSLSNELQYYKLPIQVFGLETHAGDVLSCEVSFEGDTIQSEDIVNQTNRVLGLELPVGEYDWVSVGATASTSAARPLSGFASVSVGGWYDDGDLIFVRTGGEWRPSPSLRIGGEIQRYFLDTSSAGDFTANLERGTLDWFLSPSQYLQTVVQAWNVDQGGNAVPQIGLQSRYRWIIEDQREVFVSLESGMTDYGWGYRRQGEDLTAKVVWSFQF